VSGVAYSFNTILILGTYTGLSGISSFLKLYPIDSAKSFNCLAAMRLVRPVENFQEVSTGLTKRIAARHLNDSAESMEHTFKKELNLSDWMLRSPHVSTGRQIDATAVTLKRKTASSLPQELRGLECDKP